MKIQYRKWSGSDSEILTIEEAFEFGVSWECDGVAEDAQRKAEESGKRLGRLCKVLQEKGLLSAHEILEIAGVYHSDCWFINE